MKLIKLSLAAALAATTFAATVNASEIGVSANMAITSDYIWRGMDQSNNSPAIQGGIDIDYNGFYAGVWGSNVSFAGNPGVSLEGDIYGGYSSELAGIGFDLGYAQYTYPNDSKALNFGEAYVGLSKDFGPIAIGIKGYFGVKTDDTDPADDYEASVSIPLPAEITFDGVVGKYENVGVYYSASVAKTFGKFDLSLAYTGMDYVTDNGNKDEDTVVATISTSF